MTTQEEIEILQLQIESLELRIKLLQLKSQNNHLAIPAKVWENGRRSWPSRLNDVDPIIRDYMISPSCMALS